MAGWPDPPAFLSVEGPEFAENVRAAENVTRHLEQHNWDFEAAPDMVFTRQADCDVAAKEIVSIFDGQVQTRYGRLIIKGAGNRFNLMSHESPGAVYLGARSQVFPNLNAQVGSKGLHDFPEFREFEPIQRVDLYNPTVFYQLRDVVFWNALHRFGLFPTGFEDIAKQMTMGNVIRNVLFNPTQAALDREQPIFMEAFATVQFPTEVVEWMPKPLFGGMSQDSLHIDTLLTTEPTNISHPYLDLVGEGRVRLHDRTYHMRRFAGISPKDATRGPTVRPEGSVE